MRISDWSSDVCSSDLTSRSVAGGRFGDEADLHEPGALHGVDHTAAAPVTRIRVAADMHLAQFRNATGHRFLALDFGPQGADAPIQQGFLVRPPLNTPVSLALPVHFTHRHSHILRLRRARKSTRPNSSHKCPSRK